MKVIIFVLCQESFESEILEEMPAGQLLEVLEAGGLGFRVQSLGFKSLGVRVWGFLEVGWQSTSPRIKPTHLMHAPYIRASVGF